MTCPFCGASTPDGARFCPSCGQPLSMRGDERRVVTVLFADLVGFTGMAETRDPEQVKLLVDECFELLVNDIVSFGGRVDKIVGDAIVALFGAPVAHEDDPERAVRAALRMRDTLTRGIQGQAAPIQMRIGVNTGEVLVGALRAGGDYTAMGDVVNTASRLQSVAQPNEILVGPATYSATSHTIRYEPVGSLSVRGRADAVEAWRAVSPLAPPGYRRRHARAPLIGRDAEIGLIGHAIDTATDKSRAAVITLIGEAGVGKSRLAREVADLAAQRHGAQILEGRCIAYGEANVWWPVAQAIRTFCGVGADDSADEVRATMTRVLSETVEPSNDESEITRLTNGLLHLMGIESPLREIEPQRAREEAIRSVGVFFEALLNDQPVMLVISDMHWAGRSMFELLVSLLDHLADRPFMLVLTARPPFAEAWMPPDARPNSVMVHVDPLSREATGALLDVLLEGRLDPELRSLLLDRSGGNPFFLEELVALVEGGGGIDELMGSGDAESLPDTLRGLVAARLDSLTQSERRALDDAAVYGRTGAVDALVLMAKADRAGLGVRSEADVRTAVDGLVDKEILVVDDEGEYSFRSDLVREVAYSMQTKAARAQRHWGIGQFLENNFARFGEVNMTITDGLAHHFGQAADLAVDLGSVPGVPADIVDRALFWLGKAASRAEQADAHAPAERLFSRALELLPDTATPERVTMLLGRARANAEMRVLARARRDAEEALETARQLEDPASEARATLILGSVLDREGERSAAIETFTDAVQLFAQVGDRHGQAEALRLRGMAEIFEGDAEGAHRSIADALDLFSALDDSRGQAWAMQNLAWLSYLEGRPSEAERRIAESAAMFEEMGDRGGLGWVVGLQAWVRFHQGRWEEAEEISELLLSEARGRGDRWATGMLQVLSASVRLWTGRASLAIGRAQEALDTFKQVGDTDREVQSAAVLGRALVAVGLVGEGFRTLDLAVENGRSTSGRLNPQGPTALAATAVAIGDPERALRAAALVGIDDLDPSVIGESDRLVALGLALLQLGQLTEAREHLEYAVQTEGEEVPSGYALSALACVRAVEGRVDDVRKLVDEVLSIERSTYFDRITALSALGSILHGSDDRNGADEAFNQAVLIADSTDDQVAQAVVRLARCESAAAANIIIPGLATETDQRLTDLGVTAEGWSQAFEAAARAGAARAATPGVKTEL